MGLGRSWRPLLLVLRGLACSNEPFEYEHIAPELQQACREALERLSSRT
jgi:hypothetical protein